MGRSLIEDSFDYKPDLNEKFRREPELRKLLMDNAQFLVGHGLITEDFLNKINKSLILGERSGVHAQQRFPVMCALSSLAINIKELGIERT